MFWNKKLFDSNTENLKFVSCVSHKNIHKLTFVNMHKGVQFSSDDLVFRRETFEFILRSLTYRLWYVGTAEQSLRRSCDIVRNPR